MQDIKKQSHVYENLSCSQGLNCPFVQIPSDSRAPQCISFPFGSSLLATESCLKLAGHDNHHNVQLVSKSATSKKQAYESTSIPFSVFNKHNKLDCSPFDRPIELRKTSSSYSLYQKREKEKEKETPYTTHKEIYKPGLPSWGFLKEQTFPQKQTHHSYPQHHHSLLPSPQTSQTIKSPPNSGLDSFSTRPNSFFGNSSNQSSFFASSPQQNSFSASPLQKQQMAPFYATTSPQPQQQQQQPNTPQLSPIFKTNSQKQMNWRNSLFT